MQNKTLKIAAIISTACLVLIAAFCVFMVLLMHGCATAVNEGIEQGERDAERMKRSLEGLPKPPPPVSVPEWK